MDSQQNFLTILHSNYEKLISKDVVNVLWKELIREETIEDCEDELIEYSFHHPVDTEAYLELLNMKFDEFDKRELRFIDGHFKAYILTFLYYCTDLDNTRMTPKTKVLASCLYLKLASHHMVGKIFYETSLYNIQGTLAITLAQSRSVDDDLMTCLLQQIKECCIEIKLDPVSLLSTTNVIVGVLMIYNKTTVTDIDEIGPIEAQCFVIMKELIRQEEEISRSMMRSLWRCLKSNVLETVDHQDAAFSAILLFIKSELQNELTDEKFEIFLDAFCILWDQEDFTYYDKAVIIMNALKEEHYKEIVRKMMPYSQSKNHLLSLTHIMNLVVMILKNLPPFRLDKIEVIFSCVLRNILLQIINEDKEISTKAVETMTTVCLMNNNKLVEMIFREVQNTGKFISINMETLLLSFTKIIDEKWGMSPKNQNLLVIMVKFLAHSRSVNPTLVEKVFRMITKDCTPFSLKPSLPIVHKLFCVMAAKEEQKIATLVFRVLFKCAMHQDAASLEYIDHIYKSLIYPSKIDGVKYDPKYYYETLFSSDFEYEVFFTKIQRQISRENVSQVIENLNYEQAGGAILLCCLLKYCQYDGISAVGAFFVENFREISVREMCGPLSTALCNMLDNKQLTPEDVPQLDLLQSLLMDALFEQTVLIPCVKPTYDLFNKIRTMLRIDGADLMAEQLHNVISRKTVSRMVRSRFIGSGFINLSPEATMREIADNSIFLYFNEVCLLSRRLPDDRIMRMLESHIADETKTKALSENHPEIYVQLVTLFTTIAMMARSKVPLAMKHIREMIKSNIEAYKILGFKLLFSLSTEITHEYEEVLVFAMREILTGGPCLTKICAMALEELVHNDYMKLTSENFFKLIFPLGSEHHSIYMKDLLAKRFVGSNHNDIAKFYVQTIVYIHSYTKLSGYKIDKNFKRELEQIVVKIDCSNEIPTYLFATLPIQKKINVWCEIADILGEVINGRYKIEGNFFVMLNDLITTFKLMNAEINRSTYYSEICLIVENQIVKNDLSQEKECYYNEFDFEIRKCTLILLKLLFLEDDQLAEHIQITLFDSLMHWIDFIKAEIIYYVHVEKGKGYGQYFRKLLQYHKRNKNRFLTPNSYSLDC